MIIIIIINICCQKVPNASQLPAIYIWACEGTKGWKRKYEFLNRFNDLYLNRFYTFENETMGKRFFSPVRLHQELFLTLFLCKTRRITQGRRWTWDFSFVSPRKEFRLSSSVFPTGHKHNKQTAAMRPVRQWTQGLNLNKIRKSRVIEYI